MEPAPRQPNRKLLASFAALIWAAMAFQFGWFRPDGHYPIATLLWRSAANGLLFWLLLYLVMGPLVEAMRARRQVGLSGILAIAGCFAVLAVCEWLSVGR